MLDKILGKDNKLVKILLMIGLVVIVYSLMPVPPVEDITGTAHVLDGDTIEINGQRIRLHAMDAPEEEQTCWRARVPYACGKESTRVLKEKIGSKTVTCQPEDIDQYERIVATCFLDGTDLNEWMVLQGQAVAYRDFSNRYVAAEHKARIANRGLWNSTFQMPWSFRRDQREKK